MDLGRSALLIVDVQQGFDDPFWGPRNNRDAEANIQRILEAWREKGGKVLHVLHDSTLPDSPLRPGTPGNLPKPEAEPRAGEAVYRKSVNSAFIGTSLEKDLIGSGIDSVVVVGLTTNHCVSTTVRMAANLGFQTYLVTDATATFDRAGIDGHIRSAEEVHAAALSDLQDEFATLIDTRTALDSVLQVTAPGIG